MKSVPFLSLLTGVALLVSSCANDLNLTPKYGMNAEAVYSDPANYINVLAKVYGGLAVSGNQGPAGAPDISGIDEGFSQYIRVMWNLQELPTDEVVCGWNDPGIPELNTSTWNDNSSFVSAMYYRIFYQIALANEFIRYTSEDWMSEKGFSEADKTMIRRFAAEARYLRALSYYHAMDLFGNVPFVDESDRPGVFFPEQILRADLYTYVSNELNAIESLLPEARTAEYGRIDKGALWALRAKVYLNSEVYTGVARYAECMTECTKIISAGYTLEPEYTHLFLADNHLSNEFIFAVNFDGMHTRNYGGTTFLTHASMHAQVTGIAYGTTSGWQGLRTTKSFSDLMTDTNDTRNTLWTSTQSDTINDVSDPNQGYIVTKWRNVTRDGTVGSEPVTFVDIDFPMFRLADVYLMYAECALRTGTNVGTGLTYFNTLRERAYKNANHNVTDISLASVLDERARELHYEGHRRQDLIRFGKFTGGTYNWPWKGGVKEGTSIDAHLSLYPLPGSDVISNQNLTQNPGY